MALKKFFSPELKLRQFAQKQSELLKEDKLGNLNVVIQNIIEFNDFNKEASNGDLEKIIKYMQEYGADLHQTNEGYSNEKELSVLDIIRSEVQKKLKVKG